MINPAEMLRKALAAAASTQNFSAGGGSKLAALSRTGSLPFHEQRALVSPERASMNAAKSAFADFSQRNPNMVASPNVASLMASIYDASRSSPGRRGYVPDIAAAALGRDGTEGINPGVLASVEALIAAMGAGGGMAAYNGLQKQGNPLKHGDPNYGYSADELNQALGRSMLHQQGGYP